MDEDEKQKTHVPEEFDGNLDCQGYALCCSFNRTGSLLAVGCNDGRVVVWDFATRHVAKTISAHPIQAVTSISWSRKGHNLASASLDNSVAIWDVVGGECLIRWIFKAPLMKVQFNPRDDGLLIVSPYKHQPILLRVDYRSRPRKVVYRERESEFDKEDEDADLKIRPERKIESDDDISINVDKIENEAYMSSDEERQCISPPLEYIPISLEDHDVIDPAQQN